MADAGPTIQSFEFVGQVFGEGVGFPEQPALPLPGIDARTYALRAFADWLSTLQFARTGKKGGEDIQFCVPRKDIHVHQPDHVKDLEFPSICFLPQRGMYETFGLGPARLDDATCDVFGQGTALLQLAEYTESFIIEIWGSKIAERRAIVAGLETAMGSFDDSWAVTLRLKDYFDRTATFSLNEKQYIDEPDAVRNRRRAHMFVELTVGVVRLVNAVTLQPYAQVFTDVDC